eukprot:6706139-Alexandrium_andersonii.AAC.1
MAGAVVWSIVEGGWLRVFCLGRQVDPRPSVLPAEVDAAGLARSALEPAPRHGRVAVSFGRLPASHRLPRWPL